MRIARVGGPDGRTWLARVQGEQAVPLASDSGRPGDDPLRGVLAGGSDPAQLPACGDPLPLGEVRLLAPVRAPGQILAVGLNYADHAAESGAERPAAPVLFTKPPGAIIGPDEAIRCRAADSEQVDFEVELAIVIGRTARRVREADALDYVFGYLVCNDVSARDAQFADGQWVRGKGFDTFCPLGPWVVTADEVPDPQALALSCRVNGVTYQDGHTSDMLFSVAEILAYTSRFLTLAPGDIVSTGTPPGVGFARTPPVFLRPGDVVEAEVERIGVLRNPVAAG